MKPCRSEQCRRMRRMTTSQDYQEMEHIPYCTTSSIGVQYKIYFFFPAETFSFLVPRTFFCLFFLSFLCFLLARFFSVRPICRQTMTHLRDSATHHCIMNTLAYYTYKQTTVMIVDGELVNGNTHVQYR